MSLAYNALCNAIISDSNWEPSMYVDIKAPNSISATIPSCVDIKHVDKTNIVPLMAPPPLILKRYYHMNSNIQKVHRFVSRNSTV